MEETLHEIDILSEEYPYYSLLYFKRAKLLADNKNEAYKNALKLASIYAPNRRKLQEFIENPTDYRKQIVVHPEWLTENAEVNPENYTLNMNDEELIKEILTLEEPPEFVPAIQETPIVNEVYEIEEILSHFTEKPSVSNNTIEEIEQLKQTIQQNQEKARLALFHSTQKEKTALHTADVVTLPPKETDTTQEETVTDKNMQETTVSEEIHTPQDDTNLPVAESDIKNIEETTVSEENPEVITTQPQQEPVSLNVPKIKEWFEKELKAVRSEKEEKENQTAQAEQAYIKTEQENTTTEFSETESIQISADGYISWLDELLGIEQNTKKANETKENVNKKAIQDSIIDKFLQNQPKISKHTLTETVVIEDKTETQSVEYEDIASETLAKIFVMQKQYDRAIRIYQVLIGKNPLQKEQYESIIKDIQDKMN